MDRIEPVSSNRQHLPNSFYLGPGFETLISTFYLYVRVRYNLSAHCFPHPHFPDLGRNFRHVSLKQGVR